MNIVNFSTLDLNLLRVLDAMLDAPNTTRVAARIGLSQPAVSAALRRLRESLGDPLFLREGQALVPTGYALSLQGPVKAALAALEAALAGPGRFDPAGIDRSFTLGASDYFHEMLMPALAAHLAEVAPNARLKMLPAAPGRFPADLAEGRFDLVLSVPSEVPDWIRREDAFRARNAVTARRGHPMLAGLAEGGPLPLDLFCGLPHVIFSVDDAFTHFEDAELARLGRSRPVRMTVAGYYGVARIVAQTGLLGVLPLGFAKAVAGQLGLAVYRLPFDAPPVAMKLYSRARDASAPELSWLRGLVLQHLAPLDESPAA